MNAERCPREDELLDALERSFIGAELESHIATCGPCSELRLVAGALLDDKATAMLEAPIPSSGTMWWRMRVRHRHDAEATARRSLFIGQAATLVIALSLVVAFFGGEVTYAVKSLVSTFRMSAPLLLGLATALLAAPIAGWVALRQK